MREEAGRREQRHEKEAEREVRAVERGARLGREVRRAAGRDQGLELHADRPVRHHKERESRRHRQRRDSGFGAPGDEDGCGDEQREAAERRAVMPARQHEHRGGEQVGGEGAG